MMGYLEGIPPVKSFPKDDEERVVWAYGAVYQNRSHATNSPLIDVLLRRINQGGHLSEKNETIQVAVPQLDIVRLGTIWRGQKRIISLWKEYEGEYYKNKKFIFDFEVNTPTSITFYEKYPDNKAKYLIPPYKYNLGEFEEDKKQKQNKFRFANSTYTK